MKIIKIVFFCLITFDFAFSVTNEIVIPAGTIIRAKMNNGFRLSSEYTHYDTPKQLPVALVLYDIVFVPNSKIVIKNNLFDGDFAMCKAYPFALNGRAFMQLETISYVASGDIKRPYTEEIKGNIIDTNLTLGIKYSFVEISRTVTNIEIYTYNTQEVFLVITEDYNLKY